MVVKYKEIYNPISVGKRQYQSPSQKMTLRGYTLCYSEELPFGKTGIRNYQKYVEQKFPDDEHIYNWYIHVNRSYFGIRTLEVWKKKLSQPTKVNYIIDDLI